MDEWRERLRAFALPELERSPNPLFFGGRCVLFALLVWWTLELVRVDLGAVDALDTFLHGPYLVFHEAGHVLFSAFGEFMTIAGGTLMQLLIPGAAFVAFLYHRNIFGAAVGLWWFAGSLMDCAPYIYDARRGVLPLLGGTTGSEHPDYHDWSNFAAPAGRGLCADLGRCRGRGSAVISEDIARVRNPGSGQEARAARSVLVANHAPSAE